MKVVAVRKLKNRLSAYLREVARGEVMLVTDRGRVAAELRRPSGELPPTTLDGALARLYAEGASHPGSRRTRSPIVARESASAAGPAAPGCRTSRAVILHAESHRLRAYDAVHLASPPVLRGGERAEPMMFASWDAVLGRAARREGLSLLPAFM